LLKAEERRGRIMSKVISTLKRLKQVKQINGFFIAIVVAFFRENILLRASSLALTSLMNMVPLMVVIFSAFSMFPFFEKLSGKLQNFIFSNFIPSSGEVIQGYLQTFEKQAHHLPVAAFIFLFVTVAILMYNIEGQLNIIFKVSKARRLSDSILLYWGMLTLAPIFLGLSVVFSSYIASLEFFSGEVLMGVKKLIIFLPPLSGFLAFLFLYMAVPNCTIKLKEGAIGAFIAMLLFEGAKFVFTLYLKYFPTYALLYGALAAVPIFIIWLYFSWLIFLIGALITSRLRSMRLEAKTFNFFKIN
jgi:membrane protein